jgi:hypothetical protein
MFEIVVKQLLEGQFICEYQNYDGFHYLQNHSEKVDTFLQQLNYRLSHTPQKSAFYASYQTIDSNARKDISKVFHQFKTELQAVVAWLNLMMSVLNQESALMSGDTLYFVKLLQTLEQNSSQAEQLRSFSKFKDFNSTDVSLKSRLEKLLNTLKNWGYLVLIDSDTLIYKVTGKLDYFYQALEFIQEHEKLPIEQSDEEPEQASLL